MGRRSPFVPVLLAIASGVALIAQAVPPTLRVPPAPAVATAGVSYADVTETAGVSGFKHVSGGPDKPYIIEVTGSGVALFDADADGFADLYLVNGSTLDAVKRGTAGPSAAFYRNNGDGTFRDITASAGVANGGWGQGVCVGDVDNDGREDLYVTNFGKNRLYRATGPLTYEDVAEKAGVAVGGWSTGCAFGDYDGDGLLDLYVAGYVALDLDHLPPAPPASGGAPPQPPQGQPPAGEAPRAVGMGAAYTGGSRPCTYRGEQVMCGPRGLTGAPDYLFRNNGDGTFTETTKEAGVTDTKLYYGFGVAWFDMDDDGRLDLLVANDSGPNYVYRNVGGGRFEDVSYPSGAALDGSGREQAHMGIAIGDYDNDGRDDIHITNFADDFNVLYRNFDGASFSDVSFPAGIAQVSIPFLGWGTDFLDYDNDGWLDLLVVNGHVYPFADGRGWNTSYAQRALLFKNTGGKRFLELGAAGGPGLTTPRVSRGSATADVDNDGGVDIAINNIDGAPTLARNVGGGAAGHWITVRHVGDPARRCPKDAIGSTVFVTAGGVRRRASVASGRGQVSQSDLRVHFGLGPETSITKFEVRWMNGDTVSYSIDRVDTLLTIDQKSGRVSYGR
jgi:hypothetical protein